MSTVSFGGAGGSGNTGFFPVSTGPIVVAAGRAMANGSTTVLVTLTSLLLGGNGGARTVSASFGASGGAFTAPSGAPVSCSVPGSPTLNNPGSSDLVISGATGSINFGRAGSGSTSDGHTTFGGTIGGTYTWQQAPNAPTIGTVTSSALGTATVAFTASTDDGDAAISTYRVEYSTDGFVTVAGYVESPTSPVTISGLTPGVVYQFRVAARNAVTDAAATVGPHSSTGSVTIVGGIKVGKSGAWVTCAVYAGVNGVWVPTEVFAGRAGSWVGLTT